MTKEQLATKYANNHFEACTYHYSNDERITNFKDLSDAYKAGFEAAEPKWIPFNRETSKQFEQCEDILLLFDNGQTCRYDDEHPFAIMTHFLPIPKLPKND